MERLHDVEQVMQTRLCQPCEHPLTDRRPCQSLSRQSVVLRAVLEFMLANRTHGEVLVFATQKGRGNMEGMGQNERQSALRP